MSRTIDAAASLFARQGFAGTSVEQVAESAGYSVGALYSNFANKEQLFLELLTTRVSDRIGSVAEMRATAAETSYRCMVVAIYTIERLRCYNHA